MGTRSSLSMGLFSIGVALVIGGILGAIAGYYGWHIDNIIMRTTDILLAMPPMRLHSPSSPLSAPKPSNVVIAVAISYIPTFARVLRASVLTVKETSTFRQRGRLGQEI